MTNNIDIIKPLLKFNTKDEFYHLQVLKRKKENPELGSNSYCIKTYYVTSIEYLENKMDEIVHLCLHNNARAYINLNRRSFERNAFQTLKKITDQIMNKDYYSVRKAYDSVCGSSSVEKNKKWIIDIDEPFSPIRIAEINKFISKLQPEGDKIYTWVPTKNGYHLITKPFNKSTWNGTYPSIDIQTDNPTLLYF